MWSNSNINRCSSTARGGPHNTQTMSPRRSHTPAASTAVASARQSALAAASVHQTSHHQQQQLGSRAASCWRAAGHGASPACQHAMGGSSSRRRCILVVVSAAAGGNGAPSSITTAASPATASSTNGGSANSSMSSASSDAANNTQHEQQHPEQQQQQPGDNGEKAAADAADAYNTWEEEIEETLKLVQLLPPGVRGVLEGHSRLYELLEVVMDLGRPPTARFPGADERLAEAPVTQEDLDYAVAQVGEFGGDNRAGIDATLHRISCLRNRAGRIVGLTCRVGRAIHGSAGLVADLVSGGASVLFMGRPGVGKTTAIRELSRLLADDLARRVVIVDTSNEIGGDGDVPHAGIGRARRMQVPDPEQQHRVMIEAVENHMPQVVVIDEIGTEAECSAARTIAQRGVQLVATAHGNELQNLVKNPALSDLIGGIQSVTLGDDEAKRRGVQKSILERAAPPTFDVAVEMLERSRWCVYTDVAAAVDALLGGHHPGGEMRQRAPDGTITKYTFSRERQQMQQQQAEQGGDGGVLFGSRRGGGGSNGSSSRVLPDLSGGTGGGVDALAQSLYGSSEGGSISGISSSSSSSSPGGFLRRLFVSEDQNRSGSPGSSTRRGRPMQQLGLSSPDAALLRLYVSELDEERLWEVMSAMGLHDKVYMAPRPSEADAVLAVRSKLRSNAGLRQAARQAGVPVYAIKSSSSSNLIRAFKTLLGEEPSAGSPVFGASGSASSAAGGVGGVGSAAGVAGASGSSLDGEEAGLGSRSSGEETDDGDNDDADSSATTASTISSSSTTSTAAPRQAGGAVRALQQEEDGLEEARLAVEQIVMPLQQPVELLPRPEFVRKAQAALCERYGLSWTVVGSGAEARLRVACAGGEAAVAAAAAGGEGEQQ